MPSESRIRQILSEYLPRIIPTATSPVANLAAGRTFYVNNAASNESDTPNGGTSWLNPLATIDYAIGLCTANRGDVIMVGAGHAETVTAAAGIAADVGGISIIGVANGNLRPTITFTTDAAATMTISAASVRLENFRFVCNIDDQVEMLAMSAASPIVRGCEFVMGDATYDAEAGITGTSGVSRALIENCHLFSTSTTAITSGAIVLATGSHSKIRNNEIYGYFGTAGAIVNSAATSNFNVIGNAIVNLSADGNNKAIVLHSSTNGLIANNRGSIIDSSGPAPVTAAAAFVAGNYFSSAVGVAASALM